MNLNRKLNDALSDIRSMEGQATDVVKRGSKQPAHFLDMAYYSGIYNGFVFYKYVMDNFDTIDEKKFDLMFKEIMHFEPLKVN